MYDQLGFEFLDAAGLDLQLVELLGELLRLFCVVIFFLGDAAKHLIDDGIRDCRICKLVAEVLQFL